MHLFHPDPEVHMHLQIILELYAALQSDMHICRVNAR